MDFNKKIDRSLERGQRKISSYLQDTLRVATIDFFFNDDGKKYEYQIKVENTLPDSSIVKTEKKMKKSILLKNSKYNKNCTYTKKEINLANELGIDQRFWKELENEVSFSKEEIDNIIKKYIK